MKASKQELIRRVRTLTIGLLAGITLLSVESIISKDTIFQQFALGLAIFGLGFITFLMAEIVKSKN